MVIWCRVNISSILSNKHQVAASWRLLITELDKGFLKNDTFFSLKSNSNEPMKITLPHRWSTSLISMLKHASENESIFSIKSSGVN